MTDDAEAVHDGIDDGVDVHDGDGDIDDGADEVEAARSTSRLRWLAVVALVLVAVATTAWAVRERDRADTADATLDRTRSVALASGSFVETLLTYDFADLEAQRASVVARSTDRFREEYLDAFSDELATTIEAEEASSQALVRDVFVTVDGAEVARALVVVESTVTSARGAAAALESVLEVHLRQIDGRWLVDELTSLGSREIGDGDG